MTSGPRVEIPDFFCWMRVSSLVNLEWAGRFRCIWRLQLRMLVGNKGPNSQNFYLVQGLCYEATSGLFIGIFQR